MIDTNFCRQVVKSYSNLSGIKEEFHDRIRDVLSLVSKAQKFILPDGGRLYENLEFKALEDLPVLNLPFPVIALEFFVNSKESGWPSKVIIVAEEAGDNISVFPLLYLDKYSAWGDLPPVLVPKVNALGKDGSGSIGVNFELTDTSKNFSDYEECLLILFQVLNILSCSNVNFETVKQVRKPKKGALPFDTYRVLTLGRESNSKAGSVGDRRSPREHVRRGHIRRLKNGSKIWINAMIVAKGSKGKVYKDYRLEAV